MVPGIVAPSCALRRQDAPLAPLRRYRVNPAQCRRRGGCACVRRAYCGATRGAAPIRRERTISSWIPFHDDLSSSLSFSLATAISEARGFAVHIRLPCYFHGEVFLERQSQSPANLISSLCLSFLFLSRVSRKVRSLVGFLIAAIPIDLRLSRGEG